MPHAIIVGNGIAGPLAALALSQVGVTSTIFEAYPEDAQPAPGAWLTIAVNGLAAMTSLGVHRAVMALGFPCEHIEMVNHRGKSLGVVPIGGRLPDGTVTHTVQREALTGCLCRQAQARGAGIQYGKRLVHVTELDDGVLARFEDGTTALGDFLIGTDGVKSRVRTLIDPRAPEPRYLGLGNVGGFARTPHALELGAYRMVFGKRAFFGYTVSPTGETWWFANTPSVRERSREERAAADVRRELRELFSEDHGPMLELIDATSSDLVLTNQYELDDVPTWNRGRMVLFGDAAHAAAPSSGQGASMAAEDAVALAESLRRHDAASIPAALANFAASRRARVEKVVAYGRRFSNTKTAGPVGRVFRDLTLPLVFRFLASPRAVKSQAWLYGHQVDFAPGSGVSLRS